MKMSKHILDVIILFITLLAVSAVLVTIGCMVCVFIPVFCCHIFPPILLLMTVNNIYKLLKCGNKWDFIHYTCFAVISYCLSLVYSYQLSTWYITGDITTINTFMSAFINSPSVPLQFLFGTIFMMAIWPAKHFTFK